jgi:hypothetical protein
MELRDSLRNTRKAKSDGGNDICEESYACTERQVEPFENL